MPEQKPRLRYWIVGEHWPEGWFLVSLLAALFWGVAGLIGAVVSYLALRAFGSRVPRPIAAALALALCVLTIAAAETLLGRR